jgi:hypothetical protein
MCRGFLFLSYAESEEGGGSKELVKSICTWYYMQVEMSLNRRPGLGGKILGQSFGRFIYFAYI